MDLTECFYHHYNQLLHIQLIYEITKCIRNELENNLNIKDSQRNGTIRWQAIKEQN